MPACSAFSYSTLQGKQVTERSAFSKNVDITRLSSYEGTNPYLLTTETLPAQLTLLRDGKLRLTKNGLRLPKSIQCLGPLC